MTVIATLAVDLIANSAKFRQDLKKSQKRAADFSKKVNTSLTKAGKAVGAMAGIAAIGFLAMYSDAAKAGDQVAKMSDQLGIATTELHGFRHAGVITGVEVKTMDKAFAKLNKNVGEAASGLGTAKPYLEDMGLANKEFFSQSPARQFEILSDKIGALGTQQEKAAVSQALFGRAGGDLLNTFALGSDGLRKMREEAEALGVGLSRVDNAKFEAANDEMYRAGQAVEGLGNRIAVQFAPYVQALSKHFTDAAVDAGGFGSVISKVSDVGVEAVAQLANGVLLVKRAWALVQVAAAGGVDFLIQGAQSANQAFVDMYNSLPSMVRGEDMKAAEGLAFLAKSTAASFLEAKENAAAVEKIEFPAGKIREKAAEIVREAQLAAEAVAANAAKNNAGSVEVEDGYDDKTQKKIDKFKEQAEKIREIQLQEDQKLVELEDYRSQRATEKLDAEFQALIDAGVKKADIKEEYDNRILALEATHQKRLGKAREQEKKNLTGIAKFNAMTAKGQTKQVLGEALTLTQGLAQNSKTMFKINKVAGVANAVVNTYEGVTKTLAAYPQPLASILAAGHLAAGMAQVAAIKATSFSGGGGGGSVPASVAPSEAGSVTPPGQIAGVDNPPPEKSAPEYNIHIGNLGPNVDPEDIKQILKDAIEHDEVFITEGSEQFDRLRAA